MYTNRLTGLTKLNSLHGRRRVLEDVNTLIARSPDRT
jgi:hypothetical protein